LIASHLDRAKCPLAMAGKSGVTIQIRTPWTGTPEIVRYVDDFWVERRGSFVLSIFNGPGDTNLCVSLPNQALVNQRDDILRYVARLTSQEPESQTRARPLAAKGPCIVADMVGLATTAGIGEITFCTYSIKASLDAAKNAPSDGVIDALWLALLRCDLRMQLEWVRTLYEAPDSKL